jgi:hypothetical protein
MATIHAGSGRTYGTCAECGYEYDDESTTASFDANDEPFDHCQQLLIRSHAESSPNCNMKGTCPDCAREIRGAVGQRVECECGWLGVMTAPVNVTPIFEEESSI